ATGKRVVVHRLAGQEAARADDAAEYCHGMFDPWAAATGSSIPAGGAAAARARLSAMPCSSPLRTESDARRRAASKANASAEPWLLTTTPRRPTSAAPLKRRRPSRFLKRRSTGQERTADRAGRRWRAYRS